jgi:hypothetical protein
LLLVPPSSEPVELFVLPSSDPLELVPVPLEVAPAVVEVVPVNRKPERMPVTARLPTPIAVVIPTAARRPADRVSMSWPSVRFLLIPGCAGILSASLIRMGSG